MKKLGVLNFSSVSLPTLSSPAKLVGYFLSNFVAKGFLFLFRFVVVVVCLFVFQIWHKTLRP